MNRQPEPSLIAARAWAKDKLANGAEPPWSFYRLMQLIDAADAIIAGTEATITMDDLQPKELPENCETQQEGEIVELDTFRPQPAVIPVPLPM